MPFYYGDFKMLNVYLPVLKEVKINWLSLNQYNTIIYYIHLTFYIKLKKELVFRRSHNNTIYNLT